MWHLSCHMSILHCCHALRTYTTKSVWRLPMAQLWNCSSRIGKPFFKHNCSLSQLPSICAPLGLPASLLTSCSRCAGQSRSISYLRLQQRFAVVRQLRHASNSSKTFPSAVSKSPKQPASKKEIPKASDVYRLLSLAKPEKWKLLGENVVFILF